VLGAEIGKQGEGELAHPLLLLGVTGFGLGEHKFARPLLLAGLDAATIAGCSPEADRARSPGVGAQCGMISTSIGKYCGAPPSGGGPPITSASAGPSFSSMKRSKASRDSQTS
jgi:hypothetical protein